MKPITTTAACIAASAVLAAQSPESLAPAADSVPPQALTIGVVPIHTAPDDPLGGPYGIWAATDSYKVSFHGDPTFIPYLGADYPENQALRWHTTEVKIGEVTLMTDAEAPQRWHSDTRYEYRYGQVTEAYDVRGDGLEQTFTLLRRPAVAGDLVITGRIDSRMRAPAKNDSHEALVFADDNGQQVASYGKGWVLDSVGQKGAVRTSHSDGLVELRIDGSWLRDAIYPVTVDPLLSTLRVTSGASPVRSIDVCSNDEVPDLGLVFTKFAASGDSDAYMRIVRNRSSAITVFTDITSGWSTENTSIASSKQSALPTAQRFYCMVFDRTFSNGRRAVRAHLHPSRNYTLYNNVAYIVPPAGCHDWRPDVGGGIAAKNTSQGHRPVFMVVYQRECTGTSSFGNSSDSQIWGSALTSDGAFSDATPILMSNSGSVDHERPSINQYADQGGYISTAMWMVVSQSYSNSAGASWGVSGKLVNHFNHVSQFTWTPRFFTGPGLAHRHHRLAPQVAGKNGRYLVAYAKSSLLSVNYKTSLAYGHSIGISRVDWGGTPTSHHSMTRYREKTLVPQQNTRDLLLGGVAHDRYTKSHWAITSASDSLRGGTGRVSIRRVGYDCLTTEALTLPTAAGSRGWPGGVTYDAAGSRFACCWGEDRNAYVAMFAYNQGFQPPRGGTSCGTAVPSWYGPVQIGSEFCGARLSGAAPSQPAFLLVSLAPADIDLAPYGLIGCRLLVDTGTSFVGALTTAVHGNGYAYAQISLPSTLFPDTIYLQWFYLLSPAQGSHLLSTQRLPVFLVK